MIAANRMRFRSKDQWLSPAVGCGDRDLQRASTCHSPNNLQFVTARGGMCPGPRARPHSWPWTLVPWISFGLPSVPNDEGVEHLALRGVAAPESEEEQLATPKRHPRTDAAQPARLLMTTECYVRSTCRLREMVGPSESPRGSQTEQSVLPFASTVGHYATMGRSLVDDLH